MVSAETLVNDFIYVLKKIERIKSVSKKQIAIYQDLLSKYLNTKIMMDALESMQIEHTPEARVYFKIGKELSVKVIEHIERIAMQHDNAFKTQTGIPL